MSEPVNSAEHESDTTPSSRGGAAWPLSALAARPRLVRLAQRVVGDSGEAEDIADEAIGRLAAASPQISDPVVPAWLSRTTLRLAIDRRRHRERRSRESWKFKVAKESAPSEDPAERMSKQESDALVWRAIHALPPRQQEVLILKEMDQRTYEEIGPILEISPGTARAHGHAAREALRLALRSYWEESR